MKTVQVITVGDLKTANCMKIVITVQCLDVETVQTVQHTAYTIKSPHTKSGGQKRKKASTTFGGLNSSICLIMLGLFTWYTKCAKLAAAKHESQDF